MMNMKRFLALCLSLCMVLSLVPMGVFAVETDTVTETDLVVEELDGSELDIDLTQDMLQNSDLTLEEELVDANGMVDVFIIMEGESIICVLLHLVDSCFHAVTASAPADKTRCREPTADATLCPGANRRLLFLRRIGKCPPFHTRLPPGRCAHGTCALFETVPMVIPPSLVSMDRILNPRKQKEPEI